MRAFLSKQGTAMAETALCENDAQHIGLARTEARLAGDWDGNEQMTDCTGNDALECIVCGTSEGDE